MPKLGEFEDCMCIYRKYCTVDERNTQSKNRKKGLYKHIKDCNRHKIITIKNMLKERPELIEYGNNLLEILLEEYKKSKEEK